MTGAQINDILAGLAEADRDQFEYQKERLQLDSPDALESLHDGIHNGLIFPTEEEQFTLRRVADKVPWSAYSEPVQLSSATLFESHYVLVIAFVELAERFSVSSNPA